MRQAQVVDPGTPSQKERILGLFAQKSVHRTTARGTSNKRKGYVGMTVTEVSDALSISPHDVTHALYDLQKQGLVGFKESKSLNARVGKDAKGSTPYSAIPVKLRITERGMHHVEERVHADEGDAAVEPVPLDVEEQDAVPSEPDVPAFDVSDLDDDTVQNQPATLSAEEEQALVPPPSGEDVREQMDPGISDLTNIVALMERTSKVRQAATLLREAGQDDLADLVQTEQQALSGLERDVLALLDRLGIK